MERYQLAALDGDGGGGARLVVQERHLAEEVAGTEDGEDHLTSVVSEDGDLDPPLQDHEEEVALLVLEEDDGVFRVAPARREPGKARDVRVGQLREDGDGAEEFLLVHSAGSYTIPRRPGPRPDETDETLQDAYRLLTRHRPPGLEGPPLREVHEARAHHPRRGIAREVALVHVRRVGEVGRRGLGKVEHTPHRRGQIPAHNDRPGLDVVDRLDFGEAKG